MIDGDKASATITERMKKEKEREALKIESVGCGGEYKNVDKQKEVILIKNARRSSLIYESRGPEISQMIDTL